MKAIILARVSSKEQEDNNSIPAQTRRLTEYANNKGLELVETYQLVESSTKLNRAKFSEIVMRISRSKETIALITDTIDRLQRGFKESVQLDELRKSGKVELHFMRENLIISKDSNSSDILRWDMGVMFAKSYVTQLSDNVKRSQEEKIRNGEWLSSAPFGYKNIQRNGKAWIEPSEYAPIVKEIFELYASGSYSIKGISSRLESTHDLRKSQSQIHKILRNPFYYGTMRIKGSLYAHAYTPIISKNLYDSAQLTASKANKLPYKYAGLPYYYRGLIVCSICGCRITPEQSKGYIYYHCTQSKGRHSAKWYREEELTKQLQNAIRQIQPSQQQYDEVLKALKLAHADKISLKATQTAHIRAELTKTDSRSDRLYELYLDGDIEKQEYKTRKADFMTTKLELESRLNSLDSANKDFYENGITIMELVKNAPRLFEKSSDLDHKRRILNILFQNLELNDSQLRWEYKKPFDLMASYKDDSSWLGLVDVFQAFGQELFVVTSSS